MLRITALYLRLARDLGIPQPKEDKTPEKGRRRSLRPVGIPSFYLISQWIRTSFGFSPLDNLVLQHVEWSFDPSFPSCWKEWQLYDPLASTLTQTGDRAVIGRDISDSDEWEAMLNGRKGFWASPHLQGHLVLTVASPSRAERFQDRSARLIASINSLFPPSLTVCDILGIKPEVEISSLDFDTSLRVSTLKKRRLPGRCSNLSSLDNTHCSTTAHFRLEEVEVSESPTGVLSRLMWIENCLSDPELVTGFGCPRPPEEFRDPRVILADVLDVVFSVISDTCSPHPASDATFLRQSIDVLRSCSLVNKTWHSLALPYLHRHIVLPNRGSIKNTSTDLVLYLQSNPTHIPFVKTLHHPMLKTASMRERCVSSKLDLLFISTVFPSLTIIRGLVVDPCNIAVLSSLSKHAPSLRELSVEVTFTSYDRQTTSFRNARGIGTIDLPPSLESLSLSMDVGLSFSQYILKRLVETGESTLGGVAERRSLPNLRRLLIEFVVHGDAGDDASPFALDGTLPELRRLLTQFGSTLTHLNLTEKNFDDTRELYDAPSLPLHSLIACPSLRILAVDGLRLEPLLLARQPYPSLEQLEIGVSDLSARNEDELSFGCGWFDPGSSTRDGALLRELVESFERSRFTRLRRVRLTCADWRFEKHRRMRGLKEKVRALRLMGIELVDFEGRVWSEQG